MAACLISAGHRVLWCRHGRSAATAARAEAAGAVSVASMEELVEACDHAISVCPPGSALEVAQAVAARGYGGIYLDANAIAPSTSRAVAAALQGAGATAADGGIVGPPAWAQGTTRLFVSGESADRVVAAFDGSPMQVISIAGGIGAASAVKVAYATWTKAVGAALLAVRAFAEAEGVTEPLLAEWRRSQPGTVERSELTAAAVGPKAWRFGDELRQLGLAMDDVGLPGGFQVAAGTIYDRLAPLKDAESVDIDQVIALLDGRDEVDGAE